MTTITSTGTVEHIDPQTLTVETNVRTEASLGKEFVDSIRANGVLQPILAWRDTDGTVHVRAGQRRTLAAREAGVTTVPVYIVDAADSDTAQRIVEQLIENEHRESLTETDRIEAWRQLEIEGLSVTAIAKRTGTKRDRVKTGLAVAGSDTAARLVAEVGLTLDQAAMLIEFEDDPEVVADLTSIAAEEPGYFPVAVQRVRNERPGYGVGPYRLSSLRNAEGEMPDAESVQGKPGVAVYIAVYSGEARAEYFVDDPDALGLTIPEHTHVSTPASGPMTDEQKAERKALITNNKEWDAAETVRREWLTGFLARKTLPKDAVAVVAASLAHGNHVISTSMGQGNTLAKTLLGMKKDTYGTSLGVHLDEHPTRALHVALAVTLGGIEETTDRWTWRNPNPVKARYLNTIAAWGYTLSPVERIAAMLDTTDTDA